MLKIIIICVILAVFFVIDGFFFSKKFVAVDKRWNDYKVIKYSLNNKEYRLLVADTSNKWVQGLMNVRELSTVDGMIFIFPESQPRTFWNENTYLDLDIYWIHKGKVVGTSFLPSIEKSKERVVVSSPKAVDMAIELVKKK